jgi:enhancing lycopene biosynthesis protein 2
VKRISLCISNEFKDYTLRMTIDKILSDFKIQTTQNSEDCLALILLTNSLDTLAQQDLIIRFNGESKPIVGFNESARVVARILKKQTPVIALHSEDPEKMALKKIGIDTEDCPVDDFITDRYTKILSSPISAANTQLDEKSKKGLFSLCKELVEMC